MAMGAFWDKELCLEWSDVLHTLFWEGAGKPMPDEWNAWNDFRAEWYRALMEVGKESGFATQ